MNDRETAAILGLLGAAWPRQEVSAQTVQLWIEMCERVNPDYAMTAAKKLIRSDHWFPTIARFLQAVETEAQYQRSLLAETRGLPGVKTKPAPPPKALMHAARQLLREQKSKKHWHGGPDVCPVCGGRKGDVVNTEAADAEVIRADFGRSDRGVGPDDEF